MDDAVSSIFNVYEEGNNLYALVTHKNASDLYKVNF